MFILVVSSLKVINPVDEVLFGIWSKFKPLGWYLTIEEGVCKNIKIRTHTYFTMQCSLQVLDGATHLDDELVESL